MSTETPETTNTPEPTADDVAGAVLEMLATLQLLDGLSEPPDGREPIRVPFAGNVHRAVARFDRPEIRATLVRALYDGLPATRHQPPAGGAA